MTIAARILGLSGTRDAPSAAPVAKKAQRPQVATGNVGWAAPGSPMYSEWDADSAIQMGYYGYIYAYRCARTIATTIAGLPYRAGADANSPGVFDLRSPLAQLLGPPPGGPAPNISPRQLWIHSIVSYLITGRWAWETPTETGSNVPVSLWPLIVSKLKPIPSAGGTDFFTGFEYNLNARVQPMTVNQVFYAWRPSQKDWRQPESALQAMALPLSLGVALDRFMTSFMKNSMVSPKMVITPGFEDEGMRRAFQDQFLAEMTGYDNAGRTSFAEYEDDGAQNGQGPPNVQVIDLGTKPVDAEITALQKWVRDTVCDGFGVPVSIVGQASERTYENADQEHRNYWTGTILGLIEELQDLVNLGLAPRFDGNDVGWWDLSGVAALKPAARFMQVSPIDLKNAEMITTAEWREDVALPPTLPPEGDPDPQEPVPAIDDTPGMSGGSSTGGSSNGTGARDGLMSGIAGDLASGLIIEAVKSGAVGLTKNRRGGRHDSADAAERKRMAACERLADVFCEDENGFRYDTAPIGVQPNWITNVGGLPLFVRAVAHALIRDGHTESEAIQIAIGVIKRWAAGGGNVTAKTRAKAAATVAEWEAKKAASDATPNQRDGLGPILTESSSGIGALLPKTPAPHLPVKGKKRGRCGKCGRSVMADIHMMPKSGARAFNPDEPRGPHGKWSALGADLSKLADAAKAGGFSFNVGTGKPPTEGYMVSYNGHTGLYEAHVLDDPTALKKAYSTWLLQHRSFLSADKYIGGWVDGGKFWLEPSENELHLPTALRKGRDRDQISIYDVVHGTYHETGGSGGLTHGSPSERQAAVLPAGATEPADDDRSRGRAVRGSGHRQFVCAGRTAARPGLDEALALIGYRHAGPEGHHHVRTGHPSGARRIVINQVDAHATAMEPAVADAMRYVFGKQRTATLSRLAGNRGKSMIRAAQQPPTDDGSGPAPLVNAGQVFDWAHWVTETESALKPFYASVAVTPQPRLAKFTPTDGSTASVVAALKARSTNLAQTVSTTTLERIQKALGDAIVNGDTVAQMTQAINAVFDDADTTRAQMIARTESLGAINAAADAHATALGADVVAGKEWAATHDTRTRETHRAADGQIRSMAVPYTVGGFPMTGPGDPAAPPDETVNCRCCSLYLTPAEYAQRSGIQLPTASPIAA